MTDIEDKEALVKAIAADAQADTASKVAALHTQIAAVEPSLEDAETMRLSLHAQLEDVEVQGHNLLKLLEELWKDHGVIAKPTTGDGNCGIYTAMSFCDALPSAAVAGRNACPADIELIVRAYRQELSNMWLEVQHDVLWQDIFQKFISGRQDLRFWKQLSQPLSTPKKGRRKGGKSLSYTPTPDKRVKQRGCARLLAGPGVEEQLESVTAKADPKPTGPKARANTKTDKDKENGKTKKRTGVKLPPSQTHTLSKCLVRWLADRGVTYLAFNDLHRKRKHLCLQLGLSPVFPSEGMMMDDGFTMFYIFVIRIFHLVDVPGTRKNDPCTPI